MDALRQNVELMGSSVGMVRRAAAILQLLSKTAACRSRLVRHQQRLLQFTMSQLMDSRVAAIIADTLFELRSYDPDVDEVFWQEQSTTGTPSPAPTPSVSNKDSADAEKTNVSPSAESRTEVVGSPDREGARAAAPDSHLAAALCDVAHSEEVAAPTEEAALCGATEALSESKSAVNEELVGTDNGDNEDDKSASPSSSSQSSGHEANVHNNNKKAVSDTQVAHINNRVVAAKSS